MTSVEPLRRSPFQPELHAIHKNIPILPSSSASSSTLAPLPSVHDPMDVTNTTSSMGPPPAGTSGPEAINGPSSGAGEETTSMPNGMSIPVVGAAAAAQQPKVVQTAFIHKLYNMLEDTSISHLISWSSSNESFVMSPSSEFSKVLSSYFKHTNISSFVRQLNMYGFHKVSDVFHTGAPDSPLWEFKHGNGNFKRGDLVGLREIKRRASRHALIHRDSFSTGPKIPSHPPGIPVEPAPDPLDTRLAMIEYSLQESHSRLARSEDCSAYLNNKCTMLTEGLLRCHQWNYELTAHLVSILPEGDSKVHRDITNMQREISRQLDMLRGLDDTSSEALPSSRSAYFSNLPSEAGPPLSPRQMPHDESRRGSLASGSRPTPYKTPGPSHLASSPRRFGSMSGSSPFSPSTRAPPSANLPQHQSTAPPLPTAPSMQPNPSVSITSPDPTPSNLPRRHTSADIRQHGWHPGLAQQNLPQQSVLPLPAHSPFASGHNSSQWPSSPHRTPMAGEQDLRMAFANYEIRSTSRAGATRSRAGSPPPPDQTSSSTAPHLSATTGSAMSSYAGRGDESGWQLPGARFPFKLGGSLGVGSGGSEGLSAPATRRSSMASNVHSLLNPAETAERPGEEGEDASGGGKRQRLV